MLPKMMHKGNCQLFFLVNQPQYVGCVATADDIYLHEQSLSGLGYGTLFSTKDKMNDAANQISAFHV
jgi:hypothetical protein